eukprot:1156119-Pelagomonas_calceolata.AAC.20
MPRPLSMKCQQLLLFMSRPWQQPHTSHIFHREGPCVCVEEGRQRRQNGPGPQCGQAAAAAGLQPQRLQHAQRAAPLDVWIDEPGVCCGVCCPTGHPGLQTRCVPPAGSYLYASAPEKSLAKHTNHTAQTHKLQVRKTGETEQKEGMENAGANGNGTVGVAVNGGRGLPAAAQPGMTSEAGAQHPGNKQQQQQQQQQRHRQQQLQQRQSLEQQQQEQWQELQRHLQQQSHAAVQQQQQQQQRRRQHGPVKPTGSEANSVPTMGPSSNITHSNGPASISATPQAPAAAAARAARGAEGLGPGAGTPKREQRPTHQTSSARPRSKGCATTVNGPFKRRDTVWWQQISITQNLAFRPRLRGAFTFQQQVQITNKKANGSRLCCPGIHLTVWNPAAQVPLLLLLLPWGWEAGAP